MGTALVVTVSLYSSCTPQTNSPPKTTVEIQETTASGMSRALVYSQTEQSEKYCQEIWDYFENNPDSPRAWISLLASTSFSQSGKTPRCKKALQAKIDTRLKKMEEDYLAVKPSLTADNYFLTESQLYFKLAFSDPDFLRQPTHDTLLKAGSTYSVLKKLAGGEFFSNATSSQNLTLRLLLCESLGQYLIRTPQIVWIDSIIDTNGAHSHPAETIVRDSNYLNPCIEKVTRKLFLNTQSRQSGGQL